jgi:hypothetical protein
MIAPGVRGAAPPALPTAFLGGDSLLRIGGAGQPPRFNVLDGLCQTLGFLGLGSGIRHGRLVGQLARVDAQKAELGHVLSPIRILHGHAAEDPGPMPVSRRLLTSPARLFEQEGQRTVLVAPRCQLLPHGTGARDQRDETNTLCKA